MKLKIAVILGNPKLSALHYIMGDPSGGLDRFERPNWENNEETNAADESSQLSFPGQMVF